MIDVDRLARAIEGVTMATGDDAERWAPIVASEYERLGPETEPYVGGHPEMPLHPYEDAGDGTCLACTRGAVEAERKRITTSVRVSRSPNPVFAHVDADELAAVLKGCDQPKRHNEWADGDFRFCGCP